MSRGRREFAHPPRVGARRTLFASLVLVGSLAMAVLVLMIVQAFSAKGALEDAAEQARTLRSESPTATAREPPSRFASFSRPQPRPERIPTVRCGEWPAMFRSSGTVSMLCALWLSASTTSPSEASRPSSRSRNRLMPISSAQGRRLQPRRVRCSGPFGRHGFRGADRQSQGHRCDRHQLAGWPLANAVPRPH